MADESNTTDPLLASWRDIHATALPGNRRRVWASTTPLFDVATGDVLRAIAVRMQVLADEWQDLTPEVAERRRWIVYSEQMHHDCG